MKRCPECGVEKALGEYGANRRRIDGRQVYCRPCAKSRHLAWREHNREKVRAASERWRKANPEKMQKCRDRWKAENSERIRETAKRWAAANPEEVKAKTKRWRAANPERSWSEASRKKARERRKRWRKANPETTRAIYKRWREKHAEKALEATQRWRKANPEKALESTRRWRKENPDAGREYARANAERIAECARLRRVANPEKFAEAERRWRLENPERTRRKLHDRRARKSRAGGTYSIRDIRRMLVRQRGHCVYCTTPLHLRDKMPTRTSAEVAHVDHIIPIMREPYGHNYIGNVQLLCESCNKQKTGMLPIAFRRRFGLLFWMTRAHAPRCRDDRSLKSCWLATRIPPGVLGMRAR